MPTAPDARATFTTSATVDSCPTGTDVAPALSDAEVRHRPLGRVLREQHHPLAGGDAAHRQENADARRQLLQVA